MALPLLPVLSTGNANQPLDHPYTLRNQSPYLLEAEYHRMIASDKPRSYIFPRPCFSEVDSSAVCPELGGWGFKDSLRQRSMRLSPVFGYEYRYLGENVHAGDFGVITEGRSGPMTLQSLYEQLAIGNNWETDTTNWKRSIYAHRYEWNPTGIKFQTVIMESHLVPVC